MQNVVCFFHDSEVLSPGAVISIWCVNSKPFRFRYEIEGNRRIVVICFHGPREIDMMYMYLKLNNMP